MALLTRDEIERRLQELKGWTLDGNAIRKQFVFAGFPEAVNFVVRLVPEAETADHHPDITINYRRVTLSYSTHSEGGLTQKDFDGARVADRLSGVGPSGAP
jgi:4a-hydroxytetrahydrobiopterin dehydratase